MAPSKYCREGISLLALAETQIKDAACESFEARPVRCGPR